MKKQHTFGSVMDTLRTKADVAQAVEVDVVNKCTRTVIYIVPGALGIRALGGVDFLVSCGYGKRFVSKETFDKLVKGKKIIPLLAIKNAAA